MRDKREDIEFTLLENIVIMCLCELSVYMCVCAHISISMVTGKPTHTARVQASPFTNTHEQERGRETYSQSYRRRVIYVVFSNLPNPAHAQSAGV